MVQRLDPVTRTDQGCKVAAQMECCDDGDYVRIEDYEKLQQETLKYKAALEEIAKYDKDKHSKFGEGICPYGCDTPHIAQEALK
jgi:hypothetical protein